MTYDLTLFRPPPGRSVQEAAQDVWEERNGSWPTREPTPAERTARDELERFAEVYDDGPSVVTIMVPRRPDDAAGRAALEGLLDAVRVLVDAGFVVDDPQLGRLLAPDEVEGVLRDAIGPRG